MKSIITLLMLLNISFLSHGQLSVFVPDMFNCKIFVEGDYLYFTNANNNSETARINKINLSESLPIIEVVRETDFDINLDYPSFLAKNGEDYYVSYHYNVGSSGETYLYNSTNSDPGQLAIGTANVLDADLEYHSNFLYATEYNSNDIYRYNVTNPIPYSEALYLTIPSSRPKGLYIEGLTMYICTDDGEIYSKNLFTADPAELIYMTSSVNVILELLEFEGYLYFTSYDGVHRFNLSDPLMTTETIVDISEFQQYPIGLAAYSSLSGEKSLYISDWQSGIYKFDLNSLNGTTGNMEESIELNSLVSPNPVNDILTIKTTAPVQSVFITNMLGQNIKRISSIDYVSEMELNLSDLPSGSYLLNINTDKGLITKKVIKN